MEDDLNTADALAAIFELVRRINVSIPGTKQTIGKPWSFED